jgi:hypothetical protein
MSKAITNKLREVDTAGISRKREFLPGEVFVVIY